MSITPAMQQYYDLKEKYQDAILFFRMGDFYEMFDDDAHIAHKVLGIAITTRNKNATEPTPLAGIPYHAKEKYLWTLIKAGYKVAIAEQVSDPKLKWIVQREVVRVVTPSTLQLESSEYDSLENSQILLAITQNKDVYGIAYLDISTNEFICSEFCSFSSLSQHIYTLNPSEVILEKQLFWNGELAEILQKKYSLNIFYFDATKHPERYICNFFGIKDLSTFWIQWKDDTQRAVSLVLEYLESHQNTSLDFIKSLKFESFSGFMWLDESTIRSLDLVYNISTGSTHIGTLLWVLDDTKTSMGKRYLRQQILHPLQDISEIERRQKFIAEFIKNKKILDEVQKELKSVSDIDAILNRLSLNRAWVRDLIQLKKSLQSIIRIVEIIEKSGNSQLQKMLK